MHRLRIVREFQQRTIGKVHVGCGNRGFVLREHELHEFVGDHMSEVRKELEHVEHGCTRFPDTQEEITDV